MVAWTVVREPVPIAFTLFDFDYIGAEVSQYLGGNAVRSTLATAPTLGAGNHPAHSDRAGRD